MAQRKSATPRKSKPKPTPQPKRRKIAIVGKAPSSLGEAPCSDDDWEIWTLSSLVPCNEVSRFDRHFEIHPLQPFADREDQSYWEWLTSVRDKPIYVQELHKDIPAGVLYPRADIVNFFGKYFTNTVSWMIALAILEKPTDIGIWGVDMAQNCKGETNGEYAAQRPSCEFFMGWACGAGITMHVPKKSDLCKTRILYGFDTDSGEMRDKLKARRAELQGRLNQKRQEYDMAGKEAAYLEGAIASDVYYAQFAGQGAE